MTQRQNISSGTKWESLAGFSRAVRVGDHVFVSGTTATDEHDHVVGSDAYEQSAFIFRKIEHALKQAGATRKDVVRTRIYLADGSQWEGASKAHAEFFGDIRPANTLIAGVEIIGKGYLVEIEAEAIVGAGA